MPEEKRRWGCLSVRRTVDRRPRGRSGLAAGVSVFLPAMSARQDDFDGDRKGSIQTISTRPDRVSGGDVLVEIAGLERKKPPIEIKVNGRDVSSSFRPGTRPHTLMGLVTGLEIGEQQNLGCGRQPGGDGLPDQRPDHRRPHIKPFVCETHRFKLPDGTAYTAEPIVDDRTCSAPTRITYVYMPNGGKELRPAAEHDQPAGRRRHDDDAGRCNGQVRSSGWRRARSIAASTRARSCTIRAVEPEPTTFTPPKGWNRR